MDYPMRTKRKRGRTRVWLLLGALFLLIITGSWMLYGMWVEMQPNRERIVPDFGDNPKPVFYRGEMLSKPASGSGDGLMLSLGLIKEQLDPYLYYEEQTDSVIITTRDKVVRFRTDQLTAWVNEKSVPLRFPVQRADDIIYVPVQSVKPYYRFIADEDPDTGAVLLFKEGDVLQWAEVEANVETPEEPVVLRTNATIKAPVLADLPAGELLLIWSEQDDWYRVQRTNGWIGFVRKNDTVLKQPEVIAFEQEKSSAPPWKPLGGKINLTWEHVVSRNPDISKIGEMPGLNVVSPTWFHLADDQGNLINKADHTYVKWAHGRGYQVWALFSNDFDPDRTKKVLVDYDTRMYVIRQLLNFAEIYHLQGINIDFENVYPDDKERLTQFVREMTPYMHEQGLVVSIDVTIRGGSPMWSLFLDRAALGQTVDYMMVMTYDEHWASSPVAGSVASLPWTEKGIVDIMQEDRVPASKLLLGVPYYTRIWSEQSVDGKIKVTSRAVGMETVQKLIADKKLQPIPEAVSGQDYVEYTEEGALKRIWVENARSINSRMDIVRKYDLAGVASWRRGFETADIWPAIVETLEKKP